MTGIGTAPTALTASLNLSGVNVVTNVSGQTIVTNVSGQVVVAETSGQTVYIVSGQNTVVVASSGSVNTLGYMSNVSDNRTVVVGVIASSMQYALDIGGTTWSRLRITQSGAAVSGATHRLVVAFSGDPIRDYGSSLQTALMVTATSASGGVELGSGIVIGAKVRGLNINSGAIFLGGTGSNAPFSGAGLVLAPTDPPIDIKVDNLNDIRVFAQASGDRVSFVGTVG